MAVFISNQSGLWSSASTWLTAAAGTLSPTAPAGNAPQSGGGDKFIVRGGHIVEYDVVGEFGDGTSRYTATTVSSANAIILSGGELKCSRTVNTELSANGNIVVGFSGVWNWGTESDPITAVNSIVTLNAFPSLSVGGFSVAGRSGIYLLNANNVTVPTYNKIYIYGKERSRNTYLTLSGVSGSNLITVNDANGWEIGDKLAIECQNISAIATTTLSSTFITGITGNQININPGLNENKSALKKVSNFNSNIIFKSKFREAPSFGFFLPLNSKSEFAVQNCSFDEIGTTSWLSVSASTNEVANLIGPFSISLGNYENDPITIKNISIYIGTNAYTGITFNLLGAYPEITTLENIAIYSLTTSTIQFNTLANANVKDCNIIRGTTTLALAGGFPNKVNIDNCTFLGTSHCINPGNGLTININNSILKSGLTPIVLDSVQSLTVNNSVLQYGTTTGIARPSRNSAGVLTYKNCSILQPSGVVGRDQSSTYLTNRTNYDCEINVVSLSGNSFDNRRFNYYYYSQSDLTKRKNSLNSWRFKPENANTLFKSIDEIPATAGVSQKIKGNIQFDSTYSTGTPPYISFVGAGVNQTFTCGPTANVWQSFELDLNPTENSDITVTLFGQSSSTSGYVWLDGLNFDPYIKNVRWYGYEFDNNIYRTVNSLNILTENQVSALSTITNLDNFYDAATYWSVTNPSLTSYIDLVTNNGTLLDLGNKNLIINNTGTAFNYNSASNSIIINSSSLSAGTNFNSLKTTGTVTLSTGLISNLDINANIVQDIPTNLTGIYMLSSTNTLTYNTNTPIEIEYTNCNIFGAKNDGTAIVTIKRTNSTVTESDAEIVTYAPTLVDLNLQGGYISIYDNLSTRQYYTNVDSTLVLGASSTGTWTYKIARYGYGFLNGSFTVDPNLGGTIDITPDYVVDSFVIAPLSSVQLYTDLNSSQKIHDYMSFFMTTSTGIEYGDLVDHSFGVLEFNYGLTLNATATSLVTFSGNVITVKSSSLNESITFIINGDFNQLNGNTISDGIKIRSNNLDSEFLFRNINSITFYPSETDRDNNTNAGLTTTATIYRFKYGITYSNYVYNRITSDGIVFLKTTAIATGENIIDLGTTASIQAILGNQKIMNTGIQKASILVPHTTNI